MNLQFSIDRVSSSQINGWAYLKDDIANKLIIKLIDQNGNVVSAGCANKYRHDLESYKIGDGYIAFFLEVKNHSCKTSISCYAVDELNDVQYLLVENIYKGITMQGYQTFSDQIGDSNSFEKLEKLRLPLSLHGLSVLDIGCNEGFFCIEAKKRGASRVVGIDSNPAMIELAQQRNKFNIEYINNSWWNLPDEKFDLILFLSAIHYEHKQQKLLSEISNLLTPNGALILECGIHPSRMQKWVSIKRHDGFLRFPTKNHLINCLLKDYAVTELGESISQRGDPIPRFIFKCEKIKKIAMLILGKSGSGKSILASMMKSKNKIMFSVDDFFHTIVKENFDNIRGNALFELIQRECDLTKIDIFIKEFVPESMHDLLIESIYNSLPLEANFLIIEGQILSIDWFRKKIIDVLSGDFVIWKTERALSEINQKLIC